MDRGTRVYQNRYSYTAGGQRFEGVSYSTGRCVPGGTVAVEYLTGQPRDLTYRRHATSPLELVGERWARCFRELVWRW